MSAPANLSQIELLASLPERDREAALAGLTDDQLSELLYDWRFNGRPDQIEPPGDWKTWLILAGRGYGKTRTGAETVRSWACGETPLAPGRYRRIALIAETAADARDVLVEGESGLLSVHPKDFRPLYEPSKRRLTWPNGAVATLYNAVEPDQLRGPQHDAAWGDELCKWYRARETWDQLQFGLRLGMNPRQIVTTTPRPIPVLREILADSDTHVTRGSTYDNRSNLAPKFFTSIIKKYEGSRLGRQELAAEVLDDVAGALWSAETINKARLIVPEDAPAIVYRRIVVAVDPSGASEDSKDTDDQADEIGIIVAGVAPDGRMHVLEDLSEICGPERWGKLAADAFKRWRADCIVAERNFGGEMVRFVIQARSPNAPVKLVTASRGKAVRAEPVAVLYEQGRVKHARAFPDLEGQLTCMTTTGYKGDRSPDRADALVWAATELMFGEEADEGEIFRREDIRLWPNTKPFPAFEFIILAYHAPYAEHCADHNATMTAWGVFTAPGGKRAVLLLDCWSKPLYYNEFRGLVVKEWKEKYGPKDTARRPDFAVMRSRDAGTGLLRDLRMAGANRVPVREVPTVGADDVANANAVAPLVSSGLLYVPEASAEFVAKNPAARGQPRTWARPLVDQMATFSADALAISKAQRKDGLDRHHFEYVRAAVQALAVLRDSRWLLADAEEKEIPKRPRKGNPYMA